VSAGPHPSAQGTEARVCEDIAARQAHGLRKYGMSVADNPLTERQWLQHAYEEALDLAVYLRRLLDAIDASSAPQQHTPKGSP
jgi:hypothetical protein